jgi:hypothetical protein
MAVLCRHQAATGQLTKERTMTHSEFHEELRHNVKEPLLPVEKKLIGWSFGLGIVLLLILTLINHVFPVA